MDVEKLTSVGGRGFFTAAIALFIIAVVELALSFFGSSLLRGMYTPGRLLEFAAIFLMFVIAFYLRQIREELRKPKG